MSGKGDRVVRAWSAAVTGGLMGAGGGAALGGSFEFPGAVAGALAGAIVIGAGEGLTDLFREQGASKPVWWRIIAGANVVAALSWLAERVIGNVEPVLYGAVVGVVLSVRP